RQMICGRRGRHGLVVKAEIALLPQRQATRAILQQVRRHAKDKGSWISEVRTVPAEQSQEGLLGQILSFGPVSDAIEEVPHQGSPKAKIEVGGNQSGRLDGLKRRHDEAWR